MNTQDYVLTEKGPRTFLQFIEIGRLSHSRSKLYAVVIVLMLTLWLAIAAIFFGRTSHRPLIDFDDFYIVGQLIWHGQIEMAYHSKTLFEIQKLLYANQSFIPWTYPPQFDFLVVPLPLLSLGAAYALFTSGTLAAFLLILRRIAHDGFTSVLIVFLPAIWMCITCGQNGFLTGTLIGLTCLGLKAGTRLAGLPLGMMVIKPHLAIVFAFYVLINKRWGTALVAAGTMIATSGLATIAFGDGVWRAFLESMAEARIFLEQGRYPLFRMVSTYALLRTVGLSALAAAIGQALTAILALTGVFVASRRFTLQQSLGVTALVSLLISPYAYDYDLPIVAIGVGLLLPDLIRLGVNRERLAIYCLMLFTSGFGLAQAFRIGGKEIPFGQEMPLSLAGLSLLATVSLTWGILRRDHKLATGVVQVVPE